MNWCTTCGAQYDGPTHNCGYVTITKDRLRELEDAERERDRLMVESRIKLARRVGRRSR